jgi:hypothetical protein
VAPQQTTRLRALAALIACACCGCSGGGDPDPGNGGGTERIALRGVTVDASNDPIAGAELLLGLTSQQSAADGSFAFAGLTPGTYALSAQDPAGNFTTLQTILGPDSTPLRVVLPNPAAFSAVGATPRLNADSVLLDAAIVFTYSEPLNSTSVSSADYRITPSAASVAVTVAGSTVTLRPLRQLPPDQLVLVEQIGPVISTDGDVSEGPLRLMFRTTAVDSSGPRLISTDPAAGVGDYPLNLAVRFNFNESLSQAVQPSVTASPPADIEVVVAGSSVIVRPLVNWAANTGYELALTGASDANGNLQVEPAVVSFTTGTRLAPIDNTEPEWNRVTDTIVFSSNRLGSYDIYRVDPDGSNLLRLTAQPANERNPTLSSDGALLAYDSVGPAADQDVFSGPFGSPELSSAVTGSPSSDRQPAFSRTFSRNIFFVSDRSFIAGIYIMGSDGSVPQELDRDFGSLAVQPAPHPLLDGQLLFVSDRGGSLDVWRKTVNIVDGSSTNQNLTDELTADEHSPSWSADASYFIYISDRSGVPNVWLYDLGSGFERQITTFESAVSEPFASPFAGQARCVAAIERADGGRDLVIMELVGGTIVRNLTAEGSSDQ